MSKRNKILLVAGLLLLCLVITTPAFAGPGGMIAKGFVKTWWGKLILLVLFIVFLPIILYVKFREAIAVKRNKKLLNELSIINKDFSYMNLQRDVKLAFVDVWAAWSKEDMEKVSHLVTDWYWQNQQLRVLDEWKEKGLRNVCNLNKINYMRPVFIEVSHDDQLNGSRIAFAISAEVEDYLVKRGAKRIVQGRAGYASEEYVWIMVYDEGKWQLEDIHEGTMSLAFAKLKNTIPSTVLNRIKGTAAKI